MFAALQIVLLLVVNVSVKPDSGVPELQGLWRLASVEAEVGEVMLPEVRPRLMVRGERLQFGGEEFARLAADAETERHVFDLRFRDPERVYEGIYKFDKDTLTVCLNGRIEGVKERPNSFELKDHPVRRILKFERAAADEEPAGSGFVGMALRNDTDRNEVVVADVLDDSPAKNAGVQMEDVLITIGGTAPSDLRTAVMAEAPLDDLSRLGKELHGYFREVSPTV